MEWEKLVGMKSMDAIREIRAKCPELTDLYVVHKDIPTIENYVKRRVFIRTDDNDVVAKIPHPG